MARFERATWRGPVPNMTPGGMRSHRGLVLHIQEGSEAGTDAWVHNPVSQVSAHFGNPKSGPLDQWVDTDDRAWAEVNGNPDWISVENEGHSGDSLTASQLENAAQLLAWLHTQYGVPLAISDTPAAGTPGLTGHGLGGSAWGGHYDCPGAPILAQRAAIIARAQQLLAASPEPTPAPTTEDDDMPAFATGEIKPGAGEVTIVCPPPANMGAAGWGNVWFSLGSDFGTARVRVAAYVHGAGWKVVEDVAVPAAGDRVNPFGGPLPAGVQKISIVRSATNPNVPLSYLIEAAHR
jgi:hypothetical protein